MTDDRLRMTPGPTEVPAAVRERMSEPTPNPDVEPEFFEFYRNLTAKLEAIYGDDDIAILGGEGILGLEAAVASLVEPGDRVLCIANGLYGEGSPISSRWPTARAVVCDAPWDEPLDLDRVEAHLEEGPFDVATMVHCETPTGVLNDIEPVLEVLDERDVISVVDAVSLARRRVSPDGANRCLSGCLPECFSAPPGLTVCSVSDRAWAKIESFETASLYTDLEPWRDAADEEWFPYTHLAANLYGLETAIDLLLEEGLETVFERHEAAARAVSRASRRSRAVALSCPRAVVADRDRTRG